MTLMSYKYIGYGKERSRRAPCGVGLWVRTDICPPDRGAYFSFCAEIHSQSPSVYQKQLLCVSSIRHLARDLVTTPCNEPTEDTVEFFQRSVVTLSVHVNNFWKVWSTVLK